jgi:fructose-1,6-bisphosphatase
MQQQHNAQIREDSWRYNDRMASMFQAAMGRPPGAFAQDAVQLFQTQAERDREEAARLRTQMERMQQAMSQIQMRGAVEQASSRQPVERQVLELALQHGPELTELIKKFLGLEGAPQITPGNGGK